MVQPSAMLRKSKKYLVLLAMLAAVGLLLRFTVFGPPRVRVTRPEKRDLVAQVYGNGTVEAKVVVNIASKITGRLAEVGVDQGDAVKRGQVLARLDTDELQAQTRQTQATAEKATAAVALEKANLQKAQANLLLAEKNASRFRELAAKEMVAAQEAEQYETAFLVARQEVARATAAVNAASREEAAAAAGLAASRSRLNETTILAPEDGIIIRRALEPGATVTAGLPIFLLANPATVWVKANVDESQLKGVTVGQPASISLRSAPGASFPGQVARLAWESDRVTEELEVDVAFTPALQHFRLGEQAEVLITVGASPQALSLPRAALVSHAGRRGVWTLEDDRLLFREVETGLEDRQGMVEIVSGLTGPESIVLAAPEQLPRFIDGQQVRVGR